MKLLIVVVTYFIFQLVSSSSINIYDKNSIEKTLNYWTKERMQKAEVFKKRIHHLAFWIVVNK
jgi:hypothetical protein